MKHLQICIVVTAIIVLSAAVSISAEPEADLLMGKVTMGSKLKPDAKARKGIAVIASKIMKQKGTGVVRLKGVFPGAENEEDYLLNSISMAREVEDQLKPLLKNRYQVFLVGSKYSGKNTTDPNTVEIYFYPRELQAVDLESLRHKSVQQIDRSRPAKIQEVQAPDTVKQGRDAVYKGTERAEPDNRIKDSKKMKIRQDSEDAVKANALVEKVKARAAERARRQALESSKPK